MTALRILPVALGLMALGAALVAGTVSAAGKVTQVPQPQQGGPGTDPGQGRDSLLQQARADLALIDKMTVGTQAIGWGMAANVSDQTASEKKSGKCAFRYRYTVKNLGPVASIAAQNRVNLNAAAGPALATVGMAPLAADATQVSSGLLWLKPGLSTLYVHTDSAGVVNETNETNNLRRVRVTVQGTCK